MSVSLSVIYEQAFGLVVVQLVYKYSSHVIAKHLICLNSATL